MPREGLTTIKGKRSMSVSVTVVSPSREGPGWLAVPFSVSCTVMLPRVTEEMIVNLVLQ